MSARACCPVRSRCTPFISSVAVSDVTEMEAMVEQARAAESSMLEISQLSHLFATRVEQQTVEIEMLSHQAEQTSGAPQISCVSQYPLALLWP